LKLENYLQKAAILFSVVCLFVFIFLASIDSKAKESTKHDEWIQSNLDEKLTTKDRTEIIKSGDTAGVVLGRLGFPISEVANIIQASSDVYPLKEVHIGRKFRRIDSDKNIKLTYQINAEEILKLSYQEGKGWEAKVVQRPVTSRTVVVQVILEDSLFLDAAKAGLEDSLTIKLVDIFAWDIDFARDIRKGDTFKVMFEESFDDEGKRVDHTIIAAEFVNRGNIYTGIRYEDKKGNVEYYSENGRNLRKTYLKSPVKFSRISSRFTTSRKHPVLGYTRAHRGVDYAAKSGTPIRAVGDGKIVYLGWKSGYGRFIEIRHNNGIHSTAYAHMKKYGKKMKKGRLVKQGDIIGYVGMSGLATGPHLHFEFRSRGRAVNPLKIKHKSAEPVAEQEMTSFQVKAKDVLRKMKLRSKSRMWG